MRFIFGMMLMHMIYGILFFVIGCRKRPRPTFWVSAVAVLFWPLMVQYLMDRAQRENADG